MSQWRTFVRAKGRSRAPLALAGLIAIPLFFSSLMAATLALEKPRVVQWGPAGHVKTTWHEPSAGTEARIWLWALVPPLLLILVGWVAVRLPYGAYISCVAAIVIAEGVVHRIDVWMRHHTARFPNGADLIPASNPASNKFDPGQWERMARQTALSLEHWTISLAVVSMAVMAGLAARRRYLARRAASLRAPLAAVEAVDTPLESVHAVDATKPGLGDTPG